MPYTRSTTTGGGNRIDLFVISANAAVVETTTDHAPAFYSFQMNTKTGFTLNDDGTWSIPLDQIYDDENLQTFLAAKRPIIVSSDTEDISFEDGEVFNAAAEDTTKHLVCVAYSGKNSANTKRKTWQGIVVLTATSGSWEQEANKKNRVKLELKSVKAPAATTIPVGCFSDAHVTEAAKTITEGSYGDAVWMLKGTL